MCTLRRAYVWKLERLLIQSRGYIKITTRFKSNHHKVYTEEVNKIALSSNDDKRLQTFDGIETYPYRTANEMLRVFEAKEKFKMWKVKMWK